MHEVETAVKRLFGGIIAKRNEMNIASRPKFLLRKP